MAEQFPGGIPPVNIPEEERGRRLELPRENRFLAALKNILVFLVLIGVVVASFWVSFKLGKKILSPKLTGPKISVPIPEPPASIKALQAAMSKEAAAATKAAPAHARAVKKKAKSARPKRTAGRGYYYKLRAGLFADKAQAQALADKMTAAGIDVFIRKIGGQWRVQAGAYRKKSSAAAAQAGLEKQGYKTQVIFEDN